MATIFIIEDDISLQKLYDMILSTSGHQVVGLANNGEEGVKLYESFSVKPEIIIMDHRMPIKNGIEATKEILKISNHSKIIFVSADNSVKNLALSIGAIEFIEKPFSMEKFLKIIKNVL
ncbi:MAG: response regulator [Promethearchaeota archaeon]|nr:MAG: response regulator [Candidatus Lokiarchaeota archaeon]